MAENKKSAFLHRLETIKEKYLTLQKELMEPNLKTDQLISKQKELSALEDVYQIFVKYEQIIKEQQETQNLLEQEKDPELLELSKQELKTLDQQKEVLEKELKYLLLPKDENDNKNIIIEIKGAVGGDEANLFAGDLFRMYQRYAEKRNYKVEIIDISNTEGGMFSKAEFMVKGKGAYSRLKYESGVHRVQRVPETESQGRVHTSTATVYVMPEVDEIDVKIDPNEIKVEAFYSSGAGGQSVNTTLSAVRITHLPTGIVVTCQNERSQIQNREKALTSLRARLYQKKLEEQQEKQGALKKSSVGAGMRAEKIRTYNYPQNRVTDHRYNITLKNLDQIIEGNLDLLLEPLLNEIKTEELEHAKD